MRYRLRTLLIVLALGPPVLAGIAWTRPDALPISSAAFAALALTIALRR